MFGTYVRDGPSLRDLRNVERMEAGCSVRVFADVIGDRARYLADARAFVARHTAGRRLVFLDPDTGLAPRNPDRKHVVDHEARAFWEDLVTRTRAERDAISEAVTAAGIPARLLEPGMIDVGEDDGVRLATMHRVKGLEFERVVMASINDGLVPSPAALAGKGDAVERQSAETEERALLYVAATRAKRELLVVNYGQPSELLRLGPS